MEPSLASDAARGFPARLRRLHDNVRGGWSWCGRKGVIRARSEPLDRGLPTRALSLRCRSEIGRAARGGNPSQGITGRAAAPRHPD
ncbi:hypothetical protein JCM16408A_45640 [Methylobacterium phyllosphaerae]